MATLTDKDYVEKRTKELGYTPRVNAVMSKSILKNIKNEVDTYLSGISEADRNIYENNHSSISDMICKIICKEIRFDPDVTYYAPNALAAGQKYARGLASEFNVSLHDAQRGRKHCEKIVAKRNITT